MFGSLIRNPVISKREKCVLKFAIDLYTIVLTAFVRVFYLHFVLARGELSFVIQCRNNVFIYLLVCVLLV